MANRKLKCGVIGAGWWATYAHIPALKAHPDADLVAIQKRDPAEARRVADDFGIPLALASAEELLAVDGLEAVVIASPPNVHYQQAAAALRRNLHVLVEKPMTMTAEQARELVALAGEANRELLISCPWHYTEHGREAQRMIRGGALGELRMISVLMTNPVDHLIRGTATNPTHGTPYLPPRPGTYSDPAIAGGGQIYTQVSHAAAYLAFLTGRRPAEVFARFHRDGSRLDIYDTLNIEMESGCLASIASTGATSLDERQYEVRVYGTRGILFLELWRGTMRFAPLNGGVETAMPDLAEAAIYPEQSPARNLVDCALQTAENQSPGSLGAASMEIIEAACRSAESGSNIVIREAARG